MDCTKILEELAKPFDADEIEWRVQLATQMNGETNLLIVPYIDARAVQNRLDQVCGVYWKSTFNQIKVNGKEAFQCEIAIKVEDEWIGRTDAAEVTAFESIKGGHSSSLRRCAVQWGIGRYLYDYPTVWTKLKERGKHKVNGKFKINNKEVYLKGGFDVPTIVNGVVQTDKGGKQQKQQGNKQKPSSQQPPVKKDVPTKESHRDELYSYLKKYQNVLDFPNSYIPRFLHRLTGTQKNASEATDKELQLLCKTLQPVYSYVKHCRQRFNMDDEQILYYAQIPLREELQTIDALYFKLDKNNVEDLLEMIQGDMQRAV